MNKIKQKHAQLIIIGSGPAGYTAAIYSARSNIDTILITGSQPGGQLVQTNEIENWPGDYNHINGITLMDRMLLHVKKFSVNIIHDVIKSVNFKENPFKLLGEEYSYTSYAIIIATGSHTKLLNINSENLYMGKGVSTCAVCDGFFYKNQLVAVVGGGNSALEEAIYLSNIAKTVYLIHRRNQFRADKILINRLYDKIKKRNNITIFFDSIVTDILGNDISINKIKICSTIDSTVKYLNVSGLFIAIGHIPNSQIFSKYIDIQNNYVKIDYNQNYMKTQTNIPGIFSAGDVSDSIYKQAITAAASGCMAAIDAEKYLNNNLK
ncbi:thioredoxin-disulfide reductase [Buchnera aphidicola]|uniref:Thioredoxin reductase n=1 Tax=Buchnera aphidicola (Cinara cf. splendens/pseudotsugae 3390) TaxID=2518980 RepID=A0A451CXS0_9GAMM|nr:thioredoxin-disulfide reductase [Buchnera aphidicola]VFP77784.1 Thioredoxin reductase [Buchnera aphidicola (Cinara cf. splendens/pseudotsugae 3390)]